MTKHISRHVKQLILEAHSHTCFYCKARATSVDHIVPRRAGGTNDLTNLIAACRWCNSTKNGWELPSPRLQNAQEAAAAMAPMVRARIKLAAEEAAAARKRAAASRPRIETAPLSFRLDGSLKKELEAMARADKRTLARSVTLILTDHIEEMESRAK